MRRVVIVLWLGLPVAGCAPDGSAPPASPVTIVAAPASSGTASEAPPAPPIPTPPTPSPWPSLADALNHPNELVAHWGNRLHGFRTYIAPGHERPLSEAAVDFAQYLTAMHKRVHPLFAKGADGWTPKPQQPPLQTDIELVIDRTGRVFDIGVVRTSGDDTFDAMALDAFARAAPFGDTPLRILSADGMLHLRWRLSSDPVYLCSTINVRPFLLAN